MNRLFFSALGAAVFFSRLAMGVEEGYTAFFDSLHTAGWKHIGEGEMRVENGEATTSTPAKASNGGMYVYAKEPFSDFSLRVEFRVDAMGANSGVLLRVGDPSSGYEAALAEGYEVDIYGSKTGTILALPKRLRPNHPVEISAGTWNDL